MFGAEIGVLDIGGLKDTFIGSNFEPQTEGFSSCIMANLTIHLLLEIEWQ